MNAAEKARLAKEAQQKATQAKRNQRTKIFKTRFNQIDVLGIILGVITTIISIFLIVMFFKFKNGLSGSEEVIKQTKNQIGTGVIGIVSAIVFLFAYIKVAFKSTSYYYDPEGNQIDWYTYAAATTATMFGHNRGYKERKISDSSDFSKITCNINLVISGLATIANIVCIIMLLFK